MTHQSLTTEELDALQKPIDAGYYCEYKACADIIRALPALLAAARRDSLHAVQWANHSRIFAAVCAQRDQAEDEANAAIASRDSLRERLEIAVEALTRQANHDCDKPDKFNDCFSCVARAALSAIAAKAGTGGKGEGT